MAKQPKKITYHLFKKEEVDLWTKEGTFRLSDDLSQKDSKTMLDLGHDNIVFKTEG